MASQVEEEEQARVAIGSDSGEESDLGYIVLNDCEEEEEEDLTETLDQLQPQLSWLVDRALKRLEDDYARTVNTKWKDEGDPRVDRLLDRLEARLCRLEDIAESTRDEEFLCYLEKKEPATPIGRSLTKIQADEVRKQAQSISLNFPMPTEDAEWVSQMLAKMKLENERL